MFDLKSVLETMKKTYSFVVKIAKDVSEEQLKSVDNIFKLKGMTKRTSPKQLPLSAVPLDFPRLKDFFGKIYKFEMEFEYAITPNQILNELSSMLSLDRAFIIVRTAESPLEQYEEDYLKYKDEDYAIELLKDNEEKTIDINDFYGDEYNKKLVDTLQSTEAKKYQQGYKGIDPELLKAMSN